MPRTVVDEPALLAHLPTLTTGELEELVRAHDALYWEKNAPEISDTTYDRLVEALRARAPSSPVLALLGARPKPGTDVAHERPMLSLDKCYDADTLAKWRANIRGPVVLTPKVDGVACSLRFDAEGKLVRAATRGDGKLGEDITQNARGVKDIPRRIDARDVEVRGEVYMRLSRFNDVYKETAPNPRNLAAGAIKMKEAHKSHGHELSFLAYDLDGEPIATESGKLARLSALGFPVPPNETVAAEADLDARIRAFTERRTSLDYETDGIVVKADATSEAGRLGSTAHHPRWAIAWKFQGESAETRIVGVEWSLGRSGVITPTANVEPVFVSGVTVTSASLHNAGYLRKLRAKVGARVELVRRGGVIPHVERVLEGGGDDEPWPTACPSCKGAIVVDGDFLACAQPDECFVVRVLRVLYFTVVVDLAGFGRRHVGTLVERGLVKAPADLYRLTEGALVELDRMGPVLAKKLVAELENRRALSLPTFITALGIEEVGGTVAESLAETFGTLEAVRAASVEDVSAIHGIGPRTAQSLVDALTARSAEIDDLLTQVRIESVQVDADEDNPLFGKSVVFTGKMARFDRKTAQRLVREAGGKTPAGVSANLDYLVVGDDGSPLLGGGEKSTKQKSAEKLQTKGSAVQIITETRFAELAGAPPEAAAS